MSFNGRFWSRVERFAIPNITAYWIGFQAGAMFLIWAKPEYAQALILDTGKILQGEWWRIFTFLFMPASISPIFAIFVLYFYWMMGTALERQWGVARYNAFLVVGALANMAAAFVPLLFGATGQGSNYYLMESVFLAFATLYPEFTIYLFFVLPVKVKWLALLTFILLGAQLVLADWPGRAMVVMSVANYLVFFRGELLQKAKFGQKQMRRQVQRMATGGAETPATLHKCVVCGATERSDPQLEFRYCGSCGNKCYCLVHLRGHACVTAATERV